LRKCVFGVYTIYTIQIFVEYRYLLDKYYNVDVTRHELILKAKASCRVDVLNVTHPSVLIKHTNETQFKQIGIAYCIVTCQNDMPK